MHNDRDQAQRWAQSWLRREDWVLLDTETTGLGAEDEVIQIAVLGPGGEVLLNEHLCPQEEIAAAAAALHGLTNEKLAAEPTYPAVHGRLQDLLFGKRTIVFNAGFDRRLLRQTALRYNVEPLATTWVCLMRKYAEYVGVWSEDHGNYTFQKLPNPTPGAHNALSDCEAALDLLERMAAGK